MTKQYKLTFKLALLATIIGICVVLLGVYTRLGEAGVSCPDWPGCYGHYAVPSTPDELASAQKLYPHLPVVASKAWKEMIHRYFVVPLATFILVIGFVSFIRRMKDKDHPLLIPVLLLGLIVFQAVLGMWTVTWKVLPLVVMGHLLGGMSIVALLWLLTLKTANPRYVALTSWHHIQPWALLGLIILALQIALGGWTSTNYAALVCPTFPACDGHLFPLTNFKEAFNFFSPIGADYQGGVLDIATRITIQMTHRLGAYITAAYMLFLSLYLLISDNAHGLRLLGFSILAITFIQFILGVLNAIWLLPMPIGVAHNGIALLLLLALVTLNYLIFAKDKQKHH